MEGYFIDFQCELRVESGNVKTDSYKTGSAGLLLQYPVFNDSGVFDP